MNATVRPLRILLMDPVYGRHTPFWSAPLALGYIAATLDEHFGTGSRIELVRDRDAILSKLRGDRFDVVASTNYVWNTRLSRKFLEIARELQPEAVTIQGGPHFQNDEPDIAAEYLHAHECIDYYVHGEGETTMVELLDKLFGGSGLDAAEPGVSYLRDGEYIDAPGQGNRALGGGPDFGSRAGPTRCPSPRAARVAAALGVPRSDQQGKQQPLRRARTCGDR